MKVLFLSAWYPHRYDAMSGLFVRKHALAISQYCEVCVLYLYADENISDFEIVEQQTEKVKEIYVYYPYCKVPIINKISKLTNFIRAFYKGYRQLGKLHYNPDICVANILTRCGVLAYWLKTTKKIPFVIVEHWSRYLPAHFSYNGFLRKTITKAVVRNANGLFTVSRLLENAMKDCGLSNKRCYRINNVVDDFFFSTPINNTNRKKRILNVSCFDEKAKNILGMLRVIKRLSSVRNDFEFVLVGKGTDFDKAKSYATEFGLDSNIVKFIGEQTPEEVCLWMHDSDFFLLFSHYETAGIVISESLASGLPVLSSSVGIAPEIINETNGCIVPVDDEDSLYNQALWMLDNYKKYNRQEIIASAEQYRFSTVGKHLYEMLTNCIQN